MSLRPANPYKAAWQAVAALAVASTLYFGYVAATKAQAAYNFLTEPLPYTGPDKQPLTRAKFIQLQLEAAAKPPAATPPTPAAKQ